MLALARQRRCVARCLLRRHLHSRIFIDSVFPLQLSSWDPRAYLSAIQREHLVARIDALFEDQPNFKLVDLTPRPKDGGVFAKVEHEPDVPLTSIMHAIADRSATTGGMPSWFGNVKRVELWPVRGEPWLEDMNRYSSSILKVEYEGPDMHIEDLWELLRPYGRIVDISPPSPVPAGSLRYSIVRFAGLHSAAIARNCIHGFKMTSSDGKVTRISVNFERPLKAHNIRDWLTSHPRIVIPVAVFLLGTLTYIIFDPIRIFSVQGKILHWFSWNEYRIVKWLRKNAIDRFSGPREHDADPRSGAWRERREAEASIEAYLHDSPETVAFVYGPQGSGKTTTLKSVVEKTQRDLLIIDCDEIFKAGSESGALTSLASQTGYWPLFTFLNSIYNLMDLASVGIIGKPAGLSTSFEAQITEMLAVIGRALEKVQDWRKETAKNRAQRELDVAEAAAQHRTRSSMIQAGQWHDGRIDCVAGNGIMSELGFGDEPLTSKDADFDYGSGLDREIEGDKRSVTIGSSDTDVIKSIPVVIIKNFASRNASIKEELLAALANWAAELAKNNIAHVFIVSDNRENVRRLAKALQASPLARIAFSDADDESALAFVSSKMEDSGNHPGFTSEEVKLIRRLGGRASDLETLIHKLRNDESLTFAIEDIISRGVVELRKKAFGDDLEDSKSLPWLREQAWSIVKQLATKPEIPYYDTLIEFPFKGDEAALRGLENADLITINIQEGRPESIRPGRPIFRWVFERLVKDEAFKALQEINVCEKLIASAEKTIKTCEEELVVLMELQKTESRWNPFGASGISTRLGNLLHELEEAEEKRVKLDNQLNKLKKALKQ